MGSRGCGGELASAPGVEGVGDGFGDVLLVGGVGDGGLVVAVDEGGDLDGDGWADEVIDGADGGSAEDDGEFGVLEGEADLVGEGRLWGMEAAWAVFQGMVAWGVSSLVGREGGGDDVDAGAAVGGVEDEAGGGVGVVGDLGALVGGEGDGGVGVAGGDDGEAGGGEWARRRGRRRG